MKSEKISQSVLYAMVANASDIIAPVWPMKTIIACNPLQGFESMHFEQAVQKGTVLFGQANNFPSDSVQELMEGGGCLLPDLLEDDYVNNKINEQVVKWLGAFLDEGEARISMPDRSEGFYNSWRILSVYDQQIHQGNSEVLRWLRKLPVSGSGDALNYILKTVGKDQAFWEDYMRLSMAKLNGWSGFIKWRSKNSDYKYQQLAPISLADYISVRLAIECCIMMNFLKINAGADNSILSQMIKLVQSKKLSIAKRFSGSRSEIQLGPFVAAEELYRKSLLSTLRQSAKNLGSNDQKKQRPKAQLVFCIDVRSEPFRRAVEAQGNYKTYGFAGFFGLPIRVHSFKNHESCNSCPVLLKPKHDVYEDPVEISKMKIEKHYQGEALFRDLKELYKQLKLNISTPFALAESAGPWCGLLMAFRTIAPNQFDYFKRVIADKLKPDIRTKPTIQIEAKSDRLDGISFSEQALYAEAFLKMIDLKSGFAPIVLLCGHGSTTTNNPYASALDCGACGGNHGGANARVMAAILNDRLIRNELSLRQIQIPEDTLFVGAEHNTTTDEMVVLDEEPLSHKDLMQTVKRDLRSAQESNSCLRLDKLGVVKKHKSSVSAQQRSADWAQVRPEWGLARNAAFIVAPRELTEGIDLDGRCFLHSYNWSQDELGRSLETILTAPMVVAQWINSQYYFSTVDNVSFGSGSKVTHNVVGKFGVMQGNASDLMHGLPVQSVKASDDLNYHEPLRLMTVVYAPVKKVKAIVNKHEVLQKLFYNEWVALRVIEPSTAEVYSLKTNGEWEAL